MLGLSPSVHMPSLSQSALFFCLPSFFICSCVGCGLSLKHGNAFTASNLPPSAPSQLALLAQLFYLREGCCCCHLARASHCKLATKWLRQMGYVIKCGYSNCMYASLHVVSLCVCVHVCVCERVGVWLFECVSLFSIASQPEWELGQGISRSFSCYCCCH